MKSLKLRIVACAAAAAAFCSVGAPALAAPAEPAAANSAASSQQLKHVDTGTQLTIKNGSKEFLIAGNATVAPGRGVTFDGNDKNLDLKTAVSLDKKKWITIAGHNPKMSSAYVQIGETKFAENRIVNIDGMEFEITYEGTIHRYPETSYKDWLLTYRGPSPFQHHWVHHTDKVDGTKGYIINESGKDVTVHTGGCDIFLKKGQRLIYFDAHDFSDGAGSKFWISQPGSTGKKLATVTVMDPSIGVPSALVERDSGKSRHHYAAGDQHSFTDDSTGAQLKIKRHHDSSLPVLWETWETNDWAIFDIVVS